MTWQIEVVAELAGYTIEWEAPDDYILSRRNVLYHSRDLQPPFTELCTFRLAAHERATNRVPAARRALRSSYYNVARVGAGQLLVTFNRSLALVRDGRAAAITGIGRPFRVLRGGCAIGRDGTAWFGEYIRPKEPVALRIYRLPAGGTHAEVAHEFRTGFARHVHGLYSDPYDDALWCLTGDAGDECRILRSDDGAVTFTSLGSGDETWRAVSLQFRRDAIFYATDAEYASNALYRLDRVSGVRDLICQLDGPVYYSYAAGDDLFFAVSAELCPSQQTPYATLWHLDPDGACTQITRFRKDRLRVQQFLPGTLSFPRGNADPARIHFTPVALRATAAPHACKRVPADPEGPWR